MLLESDSQLIKYEYFLMLGNKNCISLVLASANVVQRAFSILVI